MPKLLTFGVCRQAIIDSLGGGVSLISLINNMTIMQKPGEIVSPDFNSPTEWAVATAWLRLDGDEDKTFEQRTLLITPDGEAKELGRALFKYESSPATRIMTNVAKSNAFPVGQNGIVTLRVDVREADHEQEWETSADYPILVIHDFLEGDPIAKP